MAFWNIFGSKRKQEQAKRSKVCMIARRRNIRLTDDELDLLDIAAIDAIIERGYFADEFVEMIGSEVPDYTEPFFVNPPITESTPEPEPEHDKTQSWGSFSDSFGDSGDNGGGDSSYDSD